MIERYDLREDFVCQTFVGSIEAHGSPYYAQWGIKNCTVSFELSIGGLILRGRLPNMSKNA